MSEHQRTIFLKITKPEGRIQYLPICRKFIDLFRCYNIDTPQRTARSALWWFLSSLEGIAISVGRPRLVGKPGPGEVGRRGASEDVGHIPAGARIKQLHFG